MLPAAAPPATPATPAAGTACGDACRVTGRDAVTACDAAACRRCRNGHRGRERRAFRRLAHLVVLVLGAGPAATRRRFGQPILGLKVTLIERWPKLGGVCLNVGCIPSKALLHAPRLSRRHAR
jgi:hypothetical protein